MEAREMGILRWIMHAKNRSVAVHATLIVEMPHYAFARYRENTRNRIERERDRKNGTRDKKNSSQITAITFVCNFIINEESKKKWYRVRIRQSVSRKIKILPICLPFIQLYIYTSERQSLSSAHFIRLCKGILLWNDLWWKQERIS